MSLAHIALGDIAVFDLKFGHQQQIEHAKAFIRLKHDYSVAAAMARDKPPKTMPAECVSCLRRSLPNDISSSSIRTAR